MEWRRTLFEWEVGEENNLKQLIDDKTLTQGIGDHWVWKAAEKLIYTVSSSFKRIRMEVEGDLKSLYDSFWSIKALPSMITTAWRVLVDRILTRVNLEKKGVGLESNVYMR